jgi:subfamily B ATP-binding cassette protein MsbA
MSKFDTTFGQKQDFVKVYLRLFKYALKYKKIIFISIFFILIFSLTNAGFLSLIKNITDQGFNSRSSNLLYLLPMGLFILMSLRALANFISSYSLRWVSRKIIEDLRFDIFKNIIALPTLFFDKNAVGNIVSKVTYDTELLSSIVIKVSLDAIKDSLTIFAVIGYMIYLDWFLTALFFLVVPIIILYLKKVSPKLRNAGKEAQISMGDMTRVSEEVISGQKIVKIFGTLKYELIRFSFFSERNRKMQTKLARLSGSNSFFIEIVSGIALSLVVYYSIHNLTAGEFAAFATALLMLLNPIKKLTAINEQIQVGYTAASNIFSIMDEQKEVDDGKEIIRKSKGLIEFKNISFSYPGTNKKVLKNISFKINSGEKIALVGKSGGGKSTIINLLALFYSNYSGQIFLDNIDIKKIKLSNLREKISLVSQDIILFNDTIFNNISYGKKVKLSLVKAAAKAANAQEFIDKLEKKYDNFVGDRGVKLSGGQKQRIAIARAILKNSPILLLDEATSSLDSESEKYVQKALDNLMQKRTSIIIAHRLSTIINAHKILVIDNGSIIDFGTHEELLKKSDLYSKLYKEGFN